MEIGKLTIPILSDKTLDKILKPTFAEREKTREAFKHLSNIPYQDIKKVTLDNIFQTTSCFHPIWNIERIKLLMEEELDRSIIVVSNPTAASHYIYEISQILQEMFVNHRLTPDQFFNAHIISGIENFNQLSQEDQLKCISESEKCFTDILQSVSDYCDPAPAEFLKLCSPKERARIMSKRKIYKRIIQLKESAEKQNN